MTFFRLAIISTVLTARAFAQTATAPNEGSALSIAPDTGAWSFKWWGVDDRTYFIQHTEELNMSTAWTFLPVIEQGKAAVLSYGFWLTPTPPRFFLRLRYTDQSATDPYTADFDGDGIPNGWELEHGLNPFDAADAANTSGGMTYLDVFQQSLGLGVDPLQSNPLGFAVYSP